MVVPTEHVIPLPSHADDSYEHAKALYHRGEYQHAANVLHRLLQDRPDHIGGRFALAICLTDLHNIDDAVVHLRGVLSREPGHHAAAYRLGCLLQQQGNLPAAAQQFEKLLSDDQFPDVAVRWKACLAGRPAGGHEVIRSALADRPARVRIVTPGPTPIRKLVDQFYTAERGDLQRTLRLTIRHQAPTIAASTLLAVIVNILPTLVRIAVNRLPAKQAMALTDVLSVADRVLFWLGVLAVFRLCAIVIAVVVRSRMNTVTLYDYAMDVHTGVFHRKRHLVWYYQITEPPAYVRTPVTFLTRTASLWIHYNDAYLTTERVTLDGIGSPKTVNELREYLENRILTERMTTRPGTT